MLTICKKKCFEMTCMFMGTCFCEFVADKQRNLYLRVDFTYYNRKNTVFN